MGTNRRNRPGKSTLQGESVIQRTVPGGIRTPNLLIRSQKLYPVELQHRESGQNSGKLHCATQNHAQNRSVNDWLREVTMNTTKTQEHEGCFKFNHPLRALRGSNFPQACKAIAEPEPAGFKIVRLSLVTHSTTAYHAAFKLVVRIALDWEEINAVQRGNDLAPSQQFFQRFAPLQFLFLRETLPKRERLQRVAFDGKIGVSTSCHAFSSGCANAGLRIYYPDRCENIEALERVANGTRTRNSQNHNLGLYH